LDFEGHWQDPTASAALVRVLSRAVFVKLLGSYPAASPINGEPVVAQSESLQI
jgi:prephenate dehydratase